MSKKHKKVCRVLNYINHSLVAISTINGCVFTSTFASLVGIPIGITSSVIGLKICVITPGIKKYKSIIKKKRRNNIALLAKSQFKYYSWWIRFNKSVLKEIYYMKEEIRNANNK